MKRMNIRWSVTYNKLGANSIKNKNFVCIIWKFQKFIEVDIHSFFNNSSRLIRNQFFKKKTHWKHFFDMSSKLVKKYGNRFINAIFYRLC